MRPALGEQNSRFGQWNGGINSSESGPLAEAPEEQLTQTAGLSFEQSIAGTEASRDAPEGWRGRVGQLPWESKIRGLHDGMVDNTRQKVVLSLRRQRGSSLRQQR